MLIGIDLDSTVITTTEAVVEYINERLPVNLKMDDIVTYSIEDALPSQYKWIVGAAFRDSLLWKKVKLIDGARQYIERLYNEGHEIYFVTASLPENLRKKINHLARNLDGFDKHYVENHTINIQNKSLLKLDVLIDDCLAHFTNPNRSYKAVVLDYPWNQCDDEKYGIMRAHNWKEIYDYVSSS